MSSPALMLGDSGEEPFVGHLRLSLSGPEVWISAAGRVAGASGALDAFEPARRLETALRLELEGLLEKSERNLLLHRAWKALVAMDPADLGAEAGADLSLLLVAGDTRGVGVSGVGLSMVWGRYYGRWRPLVRSGHPLLSDAGRPMRAPGVLDLPQPPEILLATPKHRPPCLPEGDVLRHAGVYR
ncbi:MAG: hypothetical protein ACI8RZ_007675 [Myxococcota bacterium]|jgi:hypothetical protein